MLSQTNTPSIRYMPIIDARIGQVDIHICHLVQSRAFLELHHGAFTHRFPGNFGKAGALGWNGLSRIKIVHIPSKLRSLVALLISQPS